VFSGAGAERCGNLAASAGGCGGAAGLPPRGNARLLLERRIYPRIRRRARAQPRRELLHATPFLHLWVRRPVCPPHGLRRHRVWFAIRPTLWVANSR
jgi:hypothetical protein